MSNTRKFKIGDRVIVNGSVWVPKGSVGTITKEPEESMPGIRFDDPELGFFWIEKDSINLLSKEEDLIISSEELLLL